MSNVSEMEPIFMSVSDYHQFDGIEAALRLLNTDIKVVELNSDTYDLHGYVGMAYVGRKPTEDEIKAMLSDPETTINSMY